MIKKFHANQARLRRHQRIRHRLIGTVERPRLNVFRSGQHIYAQIIDDSTGQTLVSASSLETGLRDFKPEQPSVGDKLSDAFQSVTEKTVEVVEAAAQIVTGGRSAKKAPAAPAKGGKPQQGAQAKTKLPTAEKKAKKNPVEALAPIANNRKVAVAREVGKIVAQRAQEKGVKKVVFDRGGYAYHGRVASLAEGAREAGLIF